MLIGVLSQTDLAALNEKARQDGRFDIIRQVNQAILGRSMGFSRVVELDTDSLTGMAVVTGTPISSNGVPYVTKLVRIEKRIPLYSHKHHTVEDGERIRRDIIDCVKNGKPLAGIP